MTLYEEILSKCDPVLLSSKDYGAIAAAVSVGRVATRSVTGGIGLVLEALGPEAGAVLLDDLQAQSVTVPALRWALVLVNRGELDYGSPATRAMVEALIPSPAKEALLGIAQFPDPVTAHACEVAMKNDDGSDK